jgi:hypothetical protein
MLPPRIKVQYLKIEPSKLEGQVVETDRLIKDARSYWNKNRTSPEFKRPPEDQASQPDLPESQPASQPASQPEFFTKWEDARETALKAIRKDVAQKEAQKLADWFLQQTAEPWHRAEVGANLFKVAPAEVQTPAYYEDLIKQAPATLKGATAASAVTTELLSPDDITDVEGIGTAYVPNAAGMSYSFGQLAFNVEGLAQIPTGEDAANVDMTTFLAKHQTCRYVLQDDEGNFYVFRVVEVDGERAPRDLAEARDRVIADLRLAQGYARAEAEGVKLREQAAGEGLAAAWEAASELKETIAKFNETESGKEREAGFQEPLPFARRSFGASDTVKFVNKIGPVNEAFVETCFAMGGDESAAPKVKSVAMPESATVAVVEWVKELPAEKDMFAMMKSFISSQLQQTRQESYLASWITPQQVRARTGFEFKSEG